MKKTPMTFSALIALTLNAHASPYTLFEMTQLDNGYQNGARLVHDTSGKKSEGTCGLEHMKQYDGKCGAVFEGNKPKESEKEPSEESATPSNQ